MTRVVITADHAELINRKLGEVASKRVRRRAVNEAGASARRELPALIAAVYHTSKSAVGARGKAAAPGAENPTYTLRLNRRVRLGKLRAGARVFKAKRGQRIGRLKLKQGAKTTHFRAEKGEGRGEFILPARLGKKRRRVGGVPVSLRKNPLVRARVDQIGEDLGREMAAAIEAVLSRKRGR